MQNESRVGNKSYLMVFTQDTAFPFFKILRETYKFAGKM